MNLFEYAAYLFLQVQSTTKYVGYRICDDDDDASENDALGGPGSFYVIRHSRIFGQPNTKCLHN